MMGHVFQKDHSDGMAWAQVEIPFSLWSDMSSRKQVMPQWTQELEILLFLFLYSRTEIKWIKWISL